MPDHITTDEFTPFLFADGALPDRCFAYVPDDVPSHRRLKLCGDDGKPDKGIIGAAKAALGKGYRGNRVQLPASARSGVIAKVNAAAKAAGLDPISASELDPACFDEPDAADVHSDTAIGAVASAASMRGLNTMRARLKTKLRRGKKLTTLDIDEAHTHAKMRTVATTALAASEDDSAIASAYGDESAKLPKDDPVVEYRMASATNPTDDGDGDIDACGECRFFQFGNCQLVEGTIEADHVCSLFHDRPLLYVNQDDLESGERPSGYAEVVEKPDYRVFQEIKSAAEIPARIPYLPIPGAYKHPSYGEVAITPERNARFVANFKARVYGQDIPIDAEHQTKLSGAMGHIKELVQNSDGSVDAIPEWTPNGKKLLGDGAFKYFSPEWFDKWTNPADGVSHQDVPIGGALTNRPFFKEGSLRPLAASEGHLYLVSHAERGDVTELVFDEFDAITPRSRQGAAGMSEKDPKTAAPVGMTEDQAREFAELKTSFAAAETARIAAEAVAKQANDRAEKLEGDARRKRFTDEVMGRSDSSGIRWFGEPAKHVAFLEAVAEKFGEDSEQVQHYVANERAHAAQLKDSKIFATFGHDGNGTDATALDQINAKAKQYAEENKVTQAAAFTAVCDQEPTLYAAYQAERKGR